MSTEKIKGTNVASPIVPFTTADQYPTHYAEFGKGGFRSVNEYEDLENIPEPRKEEGMLVYVVSDKHAYQLLDGQWVKSKIGGGIEKVQNLNDIPEDLLEEGTIVYSAQDGSYFFYQDGTWVNWGDQQIHIGATPPTNENSLWIDTTNHHYDQNSDILYSIQRAVIELQNQMSSLMNIRENGVIPGDVSNSTREHLINQADSEKPIESYISEAERFWDEWENLINISSAVVSSAENILQVFTPINSRMYVLKNNLVELEEGEKTAEEIMAELKEEVSRESTKTLLDSIVPGFVTIILRSSVDSNELIQPALDLAELSTSPEFDNGTEEIKPDEEIEPTVRHVCIKIGTWNQLQGNIKNFIPGELMWCTDKGKLYIYINQTLVAIGSNSSGEEGEDEDNMNEQEVRVLIDSSLKNVESIGFIPVGADEDSEERYIAKVNSEGKLIVYNSKLDTANPEPENDYYYFKTAAKEGLIINSFYLGGLDKDEHSYQPCSHNFVEIGNVIRNKSNDSVTDVNLEGFYLFYIVGNTVRAKLKLWGTVPGGGTFLIRGAQCSVMDANTTKIKVKTYDIEWKDTQGNPIKFDQEKGAFYLCWGTEDGKFYSYNDSGQGELQILNDTINPEKLVSIDEETTSWCAKGYIDLASFNNNEVKEKTTYSLPSGVSSSQVLFKRWYSLDPVTQSNPKEGIYKHNNKKYMTAVFLEKEVNVGDNQVIEEFTPRASFEGKTISAARTLFAEDHPSTLTCTFGCQATDNSGNSGNSMAPAGNGATRGFCWNSVGYYNEYISYRKIKDASGNIISNPGDWINEESILESKTYANQDTLDEDLINLERFKSYYTRARWETSYGQPITTHHVLLYKLKAGVYEYKVTRENDPSYTSDTRTFTVRKDSDVESFNFVQTTDQQGANWEEYEVWNLSARIIKLENDKYLAHQLDNSLPEGAVPEYDFTINTGDICYNGSRSNEWIDYYEGYAPLRDKEEMLTVGNNDLAPVSMINLGTGAESPWKINPYVIDYFYTVEIDPKNPQIFSGKNSEGTTVSYKIPSLYSFNYGKFHFLSLLSEIRTISTKFEDGAEAGITLSTVTGLFEIKDELRQDPNGEINYPHNSMIYDVEEGWMIKDLIKWKNGGVLPEVAGNPNYWTEPTSENDLTWAHRDEERYNELIAGSCRQCIIFTHEMPFNIISDSSYSAYGTANLPRETAKAYLNRYHNYEFQRLFKQWGIPMVMGGHKHTCAITEAVYDAPLGYNPISSNPSDLLNDLETDPTTGVKTHNFNPRASFYPFIQILRDNFSKYWKDDTSIVYKNYCGEIYNKSNTAITIGISKDLADNLTVELVTNERPDTGDPGTVDSFINDSNIQELTLTPKEGVGDATIKQVKLSEDVVDGETVFTFKYEITIGKNKYIKNLISDINHQRIRLEVVDNITAPSYIMCQATGFKNKSNSDLAAGTNGGPIPWEKFYVPQDDISGQSYPFFTVYCLDDTKICVKMYRIKNMYGTPGKDGSKAGYWDLVKIYDINKTLEENRQSNIDGCVVELYNNKTIPDFLDSTQGTIITL